jgi:hypothetical protein
MDTLSSHFIFVPSVKLGLCIACVFTLGVTTLLMLALGTLVAAAYVLTLALRVVCDLGATVASLYVSSNSFVQLFMLCLVGFLLVKLSPFIVRSVRASLLSCVSATAASNS